ncbi:hypothetical protein GcM1_172010 [Golovinomyces cichoracearum]|uniref:Wax synthase domain-containing protein n=1 Tax=Golovinomyces cichoracearum TaxID=62708 RepID=A0A420J6H5_9PEZI|nr:hypothetical protein GcM1_172010 [Golovinomyces cichoracearum]
MESYFSHLLPTGPAPSPREVYEVYRQIFEQRVSEGTIHNIVFPYSFFGIFALFTYMCIPHKKNSILYAARWPLTFSITWFEWRSIWKTSGAGLGLGYPAGLLSALVIMMSWTWLVFKRPQWDAKRIQKIQVKRTIDIKNTGQLTTKLPAEEKIREQKSTEDPPIQVSQIDSNKISVKDKNVIKYYWQSYPENLVDRISWVSDLLFNYRGPGWNWAISSLPSPPLEVLSKLEGSAPGKEFSDASLNENKYFTSRRGLLFSRLSSYFLNLIILDVLEKFMAKDPYFLFGPTSYALPPHLKALPPCILKLYRLLITAAAIVAGINNAFAQGVIIFSFLLGPHVIGIRAEPWYYPSEWGSFSDILQKGLGGLWGSFWHQSFRLYFTAPTRYLLEKGFIKPGSFTAQVMSVFFAFGLSGFLHGAGSVSTLGNTKPSHIVIFFALQGLGILFQRIFCTKIFPYVRLFPKSIRYAGNLVFTLIWLYMTGSLAADDFAGGGLWIVKLAPYSVLKVLGFEDSSAGLYSLDDIRLKWNTGAHWWESGIIIL